jgi:hypothetical protein
LIQTESPQFENGAGDEVRTRDPQLGKLMLYQLSYTRILNAISLSDKSPGLANGRVGNRIILPSLRHVKFPRWI